MKTFLSTCFSLQILKWKPSSHNSVDFKLVVQRIEAVGMLPETKGLLFVGGCDRPFSVMNKLTRELKGLHNKIIECNWDDKKQEWAFMRVRTDKSYPNGLKTAEGKINLSAFFFSRNCHFLL